MIFDPETRTGAAALNRLNLEALGWLTTAFPDGRLAPSLVWFLWRDDELIVYSRDNTKIKNIEANPKVAFNLNSDHHGGSVLTMQGVAVVDRAYLPSNEIPAYTEKYHDRIARLGTTPDGFADDYSVPIRITPTSYRSW